MQFGSVWLIGEKKKKLIWCGYGAVLRPLAGWLTGSLIDLSTSPRSCAGEGSGMSTLYIKAGAGSDNEVGIGLGKPITTRIPLYLLYKINCLIF